MKNPEKGKVTHIFRPTTPEDLTTVWVDGNGKPVRHLAKGDNPAGIVSSQPGTPDMPVRPEDQMNPGTYAPENAEGQPGNLVDTVKARLKHLANTGDETSNTAAGFGALITGIVIAVRRFQKEDK